MYSWSTSANQHNWSHRSPSTRFQRTPTSDRTNHANASMEEMEWSDTCLDASNNSLLSPATFRVQPSHHSGNRKDPENTSPSSLLSSLNIAGVSRHQDTTQSFSSAKTLPHFETSSPHLSTFHLSQSMSKISASNLPLAKPKLPLTVSNFSSVMKQNVPFATSKLCTLVPKFQTSFTSLPAFHRTFQNSSHFPKQSPTSDQEVIPPAFNQDMILFTSYADGVPDAVGNESVIKNEDESFLGNETSDEPDILAKEGNILGNNSPNINLKKPRRSVCSRLCRMSVYALLALLVMISATLVPSSYFQSPVCDTNINVSLVRQALANNVFGQQLAVDIVMDKLGQFLSDDQRSLLVLSFQGWTGIGKNHMSNILARFVPPRNVHRYIVTLHFASNSKLDIENWTRSEVTASCGIHLFVIDEMDKASDVLVSGLRKALHSTKELLVNQSHTKAIVLLLSNTGSTAINTYTAQVLETGVSRQNIAHNDLVDRLGMVLQHTWYREMYREKLIDEIVPFLPLEKMHVEKCVASALGTRQVEVKDEIISAVLNRLSFFPLSNRMFSTTGCRKVNAELDLQLY